MGRKKLASVDGYRNLSTDDAIIRFIAENDGDVNRRDIVRKIGQRADMAAALQRLRRRGVIEIVSVESQTKRNVSRVRLIGDVAREKGAGLIRVGGKR